MRVLVILAHPNKGSLNHTIADTVTRTLRDGGQEVIFHDLYQDRFDPVLPPAEASGKPTDPVVQRHCDELANADGIVIIHPNWWGQPPAILKGWVDRVFRTGVAYKFEEIGGGVGRPVGLLKARAAVVFNTSNTPKDVEIKVYGDPLEVIWKNCIFDLCGVKDFHRIMYGPVISSTPDQRASWLRDVEQTINKFFPKSSGPRIGVRQ